MRFRYGDPVPRVDSVQFIPPPLYCLHCSYDLRGLRSSRCPECGSEFDYDEWLRVVNNIGLELPEAERTVRRAPRSWQIALAACLLHLSGLTMPCNTYLRCAARAAELGGATIGIVFGVKALRTLWLPDWAQEQLPVRLNPIEPWAGIVGCGVVYVLLLVM